MAIEQEQKRQYLYNFLSSCCEMYLAEKLFIRNIKQLVILADPLQPITYYHLNAILTKEEINRLFGSIEDILEYHTRVLLPALENILLLFSGEIQELIKMELRKQRLLLDEIPPPGNNFHLATELIRFIKIEIIETTTQGLPINNSGYNSYSDYSEVKTTNQQVITERNVHAALILDVMNKLANLNYLHKFFPPQATSEYAENIWRNQIAFQELTQQRKVDKLNALCHSHLNLSFTNEQHQIQQMPIMYALFFRNLRAAAARYYEYELSNDQAKTPLASNVNPHDPSSDLRLKKLFASCAQADKLINQIQNLLDNTSSLAPGLEKTQRQQLKRPPPALAQTFIININLALNLAKSASWQTACNWPLLRKTFADNELISVNHNSPVYWYLRSSYGSNFIKIVATNSKKSRRSSKAVNMLTLSIISENIRNNADLLEASNLLMLFIAMLNPASYRTITLNCNIPAICRDLCILAINKNINFLALDQKTKAKLRRYIAQHPDEIDLEVEGDPETIITQLQTLFDLGFIPALNPEAEELLRIYTLSIDRKKMGARIQITNTDSLIASKQVLYCLNNGIMFTLSSNAEQAIKTALTKQADVISAAIQARSYVDADFCLRTVLKLGMVPIIDDINTKQLFQQYVDFAYNTNIDNKIVVNYPITINNTELALKQLQALLQAGIPAKFSTAAASKQIKMLAAKTIRKVTITSPTALAAIDMINYAFSLNLQITLTESTRHQIIYDIVTKLTAANSGLDLAKLDPAKIDLASLNIPELTLTAASFNQFKFCLEHGFKLRLTQAVITKIVNSLKQSANNHLTIIFSSYPPDSYLLLLAQIAQIETVNSHLTIPIKYYCDSVTKTYNSHLFHSQLEKVLADFIHRHHDLLAEVAELSPRLPGHRSAAATYQWSALQQREISREKVIYSLQQRLSMLEYNDKITATVKFVMLVELLREGCNTEFSKFFKKLLADLAPLQRIIDGMLYDISKTILPLTSKGEKIKSAMQPWYPEQHWQQQAKKAASELEKQMVDAVEQAHKIALTSFFDANKFNKTYKTDIHKAAAAIPLISAAEHNLIHSSTPLTAEQLNLLSSYAAEKRLKSLGEKISLGKIASQDIEPINAELKALLKIIEQ